MPPTPTPIPAYVAGEEDLAYAAFAQYYDENCWETVHFDNGASLHTAIDLSQPGRATYTGGGIWRFRIMEKKTYVDELEERTYAPEKKVITTRSLPDGTWETPCPDAGTYSESDYYAEEDQYDDLKPPDDVVDPDEGSP